MKSFKIVRIFSVGMGLALGSGLALADSPHFLFANSSISSATGVLTVAFKEVGLGSTLTTENVTLTVDTASGTYQCFNNGGNHPKAGNKETVSTFLTTSGAFPVRNGQTTGAITAGPPGPGAFSCPGGQELFLVAVTYTGITVTGSAGGSLGATPDPISTGPIMVAIP
jgi:hypothetical protein